jgi:hypothetical protein
MVMDGAGNLYLAGGFTGTVDFDPGPNQYLLTGSGTNNTYVLKLDSAGNFLWAAAFNSSSGGNGLRGIAVDPMGDVYLVGNLIGTADFDPGAGTYNLTSVPGTFSDGSPTGDFFVVKLTQ